MEIRKAALEDIDTLVALRRRQLEEEGQAPNQNMDDPLRAFFRQWMEREALTQWLVWEEGSAIATGALIVQAFPPSFANPSGLRGYVANMYTLPRHRGRGLATSLLGRIRAQAVEQGLPRLWLGASPMGRPVYEKFGFVPASTTMEMQL